MKCSVEGLNSVNVWHGLHVSIEEANSGADKMRDFDCDYGGIYQYTGIHIKKH